MAVFSAKVTCAELPLFLLIRNKGDIHRNIFESETTLSTISRGTVVNWVLPSMHGIGDLLEISLTVPLSS